MSNPRVDDHVFNRLRNALILHACGDAYGAQFEFQDHSTAGRNVGVGERRMLPSPVWETAAGQVTDDHEMTAALAACIADNGGCYHQNQARRAYEHWLESDPFDAGNTVASGLLGDPIRDSIGNGALMRCIPVVAAARGNPARSRLLAQRDCRLTHPSPDAVVASTVYAEMLCEVIARNRLAADIAERRHLIEGPEAYPPGTCKRSLLAAVDALARWQGSSASEDPETVRYVLSEVAARGGDTDTDCAVAGGLLGAAGAPVPEDWKRVVFDLDTSAGSRPRPAEYHPAATLAALDRIEEWRTP